MSRITLPTLLIFSVACGGHRQEPAVTPDPTPADQAVPAPNMHPARADDPSSTAGLLPQTPVLDSTVPAEEVAAELRLAADSAADEAVLEALAAAHTFGDEADADADLGAPAGGAKAGGAVTWDIDVASFNSHHRVQYYLDFFNGPGRERMGIWLTRLPRYEVMIRDRLQAEGLPGDLVYLALIESGFSNTATSRARAVGMWQFMKGTAKLYGLRVDSWVDERRDPFRATDAAARHLKDLNDRFGSLYLAAAAYNAGSGKVSRSLVRLPGDDADPIYSDATFFRLYDTKLLRRETKDYVPKLIAAALIAKEPARYGFVPGQAEPAAYDSIVVPDMTGLDVIARLADTTLAAVREMNPQYLRLTTPPKVASTVRIPPGKGPSTATAYAELPVKRRVTFIEHIVARGEILGGIARRYGVSLQYLTDANPRVRPRSLRPGQRLIIPTGGPLSKTLARRMADPVVPAGTSTSAFHRVRRGETLSELADEYGATVRDLQTWNTLGRSSRIRAGQRLRVRAPGSRPAAAEKAPAGSPEPGGRMHVVRRGETLSGLAKRYRVSVQALRQANGMSNGATLKAGASLRVPG